MSKILYEANGHYVKAVKVETIANGQLVVHLHCCDNPETEHRHTMGNLHLLSSADVEAKLTEISQFVAEQHQSLEAAKKHIESLIDVVSPVSQESSMKVVG